MSDTDQQPMMMDSMFAEPDDDYKPEDTEYRTVTHQRIHAADQMLPLRLVPEHVLWGHLLYNAAVSLAHLFDQRPELVRGKRVLELGAAAGLPSLTVLLNGAASCVMSDYTDSVLLQNMEFNARTNLESVPESRWAVVGYIWGKDPQPLLLAASGDQTEPFDVVILSDLISTTRSTKLF